MSDPTGDEMSGVAVRIMSDPMSEMAYDLQVAVKKLELDMKLDSLDMEIIQCYNTGTYSFNDIAIELCRSKATIKQRIYKISTHRHLAFSRKKGII